MKHSFKLLILFNLILGSPSLFASWLGDFSGFGGRRAIGPSLVAGMGQVASSFAPLSNVLLDGPHFRTESGASVTGTFQPEAWSTRLWSGQFSYPFIAFKNSNPRKVTLGFSALGPFGDIRRFRASTPYDFMPLRDALRDSQFRVALQSAVDLYEHQLFLRAGVQFFITSSGSAEAILIGNNPTARLAADVGLNSALLLGLSHETDQNEFSLTFQQEVAPKITQGFTGQISLGNLRSFEQPILFRSTLYFEPNEVRVQWRHQLKDLYFRLGMSWQNWSRYQPAFLTAETKDASGNPVVTELPLLTLGNTLNPELVIGSDSLLPLKALAYYRYSPTPVRDFSGPANLLDSNLHQVGIELSQSLGILGWEEATLTLSADKGWWTRQEVKKAKADFVGAPGYVIEGGRYRLGTQISVAL